MNILSTHGGHNATAALILDNKLECVLTEERFTNVKRTSGFPINSVEYIVSHYGLDASNIDYFVFSSLADGTNNFRWRPAESLEEARRARPFTRIFNSLMKYPALQGLGAAFTSSLFQYRAGRSQKEAIAQMKSKFSFRDSQIKFVHHHVSHAYAPIGFFNLHKKQGSFLVFTLDGYGDNLCGSIGMYENGSYSQLEKIHYFDSVAWIYAAVTHYLGMQHTEHEYKVMGLAAYPSEKYASKLYEKKFSQLLDVQGGKLRLKHKTVNVHLFAQSTLQPLLFLERFDNVAYCVQKLLEDKIVSWISQKMSQYKTYNIACSGGLFMNVKMNKKIQELPSLQLAYFMPSAGDESLPIGSAFSLLEQQGKCGASPETVYLGKEYSETEISSYLSENGIDKKYSISKPKNVEKEVAALVHEGHIVGRFVGRNEWGARSLGNRAILADPSQLECIDRINNAIKCRDFWMPFAPSILEENFEDYALTNKKAPPFYMNTSFDTTQKGRQEIKAATHRKDGTIRPNVVLDSHNKKYAGTISQFKKLSGIGAVLNTSLNLHGYPMVGFLKELFFTMDNSDLNNCMLEGYLIRKKA